MLTKLFKLHKKPKKQKPCPENETCSSSALKIVHAGGFVESYYMAIPAVRILERYPSCVLAKPEVFRRPWDSIVRPEKILVPGKKYFLVPVQTVKKLRRRIKKPTEDNNDVSVSFANNENVSVLRIKKHVSFAGAEVKQKRLDWGNTLERRNRKKKTRKGKRSPWKVSKANWQPSLNSIVEQQGDW